MSNTNVIERLFAAGAHFGFSKSRRHPTAAPYIFTNKQGTDIFDLEKTAALLEDAKETIKQAGTDGKTVLFVGTKDEVAKLVKNYAEKAESPYVVNRWIGGILTNFAEIKKRIARLTDLIAKREAGDLERRYTKKERVVLGREIDKLSFNFGGIATLERLPQLMVVVDPRHDAIAITEAKDMNIPVIGIMSSDCDVASVSQPVLVNDALTTSVELALAELVEAYLEGKKSYTPAPARRTNNTPRTPQRQTTASY